MLDFWHCRERPVGNGYFQQFVNAQILPFVGYILVEKSQRVDQNRTRIAVWQGRGVVLLGELNALRIDRQRQMNVIRHRPAKLMIKRDLPYGRFDQVRPAHNFRHALEMIVDDHRQVIRKQTITTVNNKIFTCQTFIRPNLTGEPIVEAGDGRAL